jgi:hypothetical protein
MKRFARAVIAVLILAATMFGQDAATTTQESNEPIQGKSRTEVVDGLWRMATQGDLLTPDGWSKACGLFTTPIPFPGYTDVLVMSNDWGPAYEYQPKDGNTEVGLGYINLGRVDSSLRYTPPPKTEFVKTAFLYHMVAVPAYLMMYGPDGKTLVQKKSVGYRVWQIQGSPGTPWATVNTVIRYVLEMRRRTADPAIKRNADQTIARLLELH